MSCEIEYVDADETSRFADLADLKCPTIKLPQLRPPCHEPGEINTTISTIFALAGGLQISPKELVDFDFTPVPNVP